MGRLKTNFLLMLLIDTLCIILALTFAYLLRFEFVLETVVIHQMLLVLPFLIVLKLSVFYYFEMYRGMYRYTSFIDVFHVIKATIVSTAITITVILFVNRFENLSRAVFVLDGLFTFFLAIGTRVLIRYSYSTIHPPSFLQKASKKKNMTMLLLVGAGQMAEKIIREVHDNKGLPFRIVGLVDDDEQKVGKKIHGYPIYGTLEELPNVIKDSGAEELLITIASASSTEMQNIVKSCQQTSLPHKIVPGYGELISGKSTIQSIRQIDYRDLLGRPKVDLDQGKIGGYLKDKVVFVTGAGGSIGSELCRQILNFYPKELILFDASEENLYNLEMELRHECNFTDYVAVLGKIQNRDLLNSLFKQYSPSVVFHAAAYKHVPLVETNPWEAIFNNVFAVRNLIETSIFHSVSRFVLVSTDKAVRPTNVMGASKRLTELLLLAYGKEKWDLSLSRNENGMAGEFCEYPHPDPLIPAQHKTAFMAVRFGNVLGSSGSVVPLFRKQILQGGPVTVTHPDMTRYFMSIDEAAQLILQAGAMGNGGEIFILKMGASVKIVELANDLIRLLGYEPDSEIKIEYTGLRPGEKLFEELITEGEGIVETSHEKIMVLRGDGGKYFEMEERLSLLAKKAMAHDAKGIKETLHDLIPEYEPDYSATSVVL